MGAAQILKDVILRPGAMHITMSFLGFIGTLMKGSSLDTLVGSAFGGLTGIMSGKVRAMRAFRMVSAALLENFLQANENNFDDILAHIEEETPVRKALGEQPSDANAPCSSVSSGRERGKLALPTVVH